MTTQRLINNKTNIIRIFSIGIGLVIMIATVKFGQLDLGYRLLEKYPPDFTTNGWWKLFGAFSASAAIFLALKPSIPGNRQFLEEFSRSALVLACSFIVFGFLSWLMWSIVHTPEILRHSTKEGIGFTLLSEVFLAVSVIVALAALPKANANSNAKIGPITPIIPLLAIALVTFLILMEEMSWGQHLMGFNTPELFANNIQNETNIHNFYTYRFELAYYSTAFILFFLLPWIWPKQPKGILKLVSFYIPPSGFVLISAPLAGLFFESWNTVPYQITLFLGIFILLHNLIDPSRSSKLLRIWTGVLALQLTLSQVIFLQYGHGLIEGHELSEFKELLITFLMLIYVIWLTSKIRQTK